MGKVREDETTDTVMPLLQALDIAFQIRHERETGSDLTEEQEALVALYERLRVVDGPLFAKWRKANEGGSDWLDEQTKIRQQ